LEIERRPLGVGVTVPKTLTTAGRAQYSSFSPVHRRESALAGDEEGEEGGQVPKKMRRRLPRQKTDWLATYTIEGVPGRLWGACEVLDISILGAGIWLSEAPRPEDDLIGRPILVEVQAPAGASITLQMLGEIRYTEAGPRGGTRVGVEFLHLSDTEKAILDVLEHMRAVW
jgi:hypothetical protein